MGRQKRIVIIAGPNGAGKTTFAREYLTKEVDFPDFINVDLIAAGLSPFDPQRAALQAGRVMLSELERRVRKGESFAFETTLSGHLYAKLIPRWRRSGYRVRLVFLSLTDVEMAIDRVALRVSYGGHDIPTSVIRRRFKSGFSNFRNIYANLVDKWEWYDNSDKPPQLISEGFNQRR